MTNRLKRREVAESLGVAENTVWRWEKGNKSPVKPTKLKRTREVFYRPEDVETLRDWMNAVDDGTATEGRA